ncbi:dual specificity protein kinase TTK isoform X5 [Ailuropoda melanoleuca]|uniref:dual specificity protein kinase TTK isoform X5 n=1 Tax=Ailuropoda melanoleuca TaxID=9646 RepID=UPI0014940FA6|nr:dual specificity protein kinase TTK isoform X5 [Ailuropoda melanoleuca]
MEAEDLSGRELTIDSIMNKVRDIKNKFKNEDLTDELSLNKVSADTTDNSGTVNQIMMMANNPEDWLNLLLKLEKNSVPLNDALLNKLIGRYSQAIEALPPDKYGQNESFAQIQVRFAELKAIQEPDDARDYFQMARANCKKFAFAHISFAQFELSQGNFKKSKQLLHKAVECGAVPLEMLEIAIRNLNLQKKQLLSEEEKKSLVLTSQESFPSSLGHLQNRNISCDSRGQTTKARFLYGENMPPQDSEIGHRNPLKQTNKAKRSCPFGRVPVNLLSSPDYGKTDGSVVPSFTKSNRQTSGSELRDMIVPGSKSSGNDSSELRNFKSIQNIHSKEPLISDEKSSELITDSVTLKNKTESSLLTKLEETKEHQEPKVPESNQKQWQFVRKPECVNQNPAASSNQWQIPEISRKADTEQKQTTFEQPAFSVSRQSPPISAPKWIDPKSICKTPSSSAMDDYMSCFRTPVVKNDFPPPCQLSTPYSQLAYFQQQQQQIPVTPLQTLQISASSSTNECISVKGRMYSILKQIGSGGSSKVFQVLNEKKQIHAIKYVNLEEADNQTIESYRNEIAYLNKLQQHSDKIIRLYDYEITDQYIYMVMECGNIDLNSWLKKKKSINPWERKSYWKNMLEAVYTIHQHGIVHSDLKPANFLIVDGMLKLIDFGIANQMQPDTTSIVKDSQVGTVNYMPPEAIKDMSSSRENGKSKSKISPKSDVWSLGCILYYMTYGKTPFQHIINQISKLHAIIDPNHEIEFPDIPEKDLQDVLKCCLIRDPKQRISIPELLEHPYVQIQTHPAGNQMAKGTTEEMKYVLGQLVGLNSPNSILKAAKTLYDHYSSGERHDSSSSKTFEKKWEKK